MAPGRNFRLLILNSLFFANVSAAHWPEPDFERLLPLTPYERVHQGLMQFWQQAEQPVQQYQTLNTVWQELVQWDLAGPAAPPLRTNDIAYLVRLLDHIQQQLNPSLTRTPAGRQLLALVRLKLLKYR